MIERLKFGTERMVGQWEPCNILAGQPANWLKSYRTSGRRVSSACSKSGVRLARRSAVDGVPAVGSTSPEGLVPFVISGRVPRVWLLIGRHDVLKERTEIQINEIFMPCIHRGKAGRIIWRRPRVV